MKDYPASKANINIKFSETKMPDVFEREKHMAKRTVKRNGSALKKIEHTYTDDVKRQTKKNKIKGAIFASANT